MGNHQNQLNNLYSTTIDKVIAEADEGNEEDNPLIVATSLDEQTNS